MPKQARRPAKPKAGSYGAVLLRIAVAVESLEEGQRRIEGKLDRALKRGRP